MSGPALERIRAALEQRGGKITRQSRGIKALCPAHDDHNPSLSVTETETRATVRCFAGCEDVAVLGALDLTVRDLYNTPRGRDLARYVYTDARGATTRTVHRREGKRFIQSGNTEATPDLYRLPQVLAAVAAGRTVYLVEGEEDVHALEGLGAVATSAPQGAGGISGVDLAPLTGAEVVAVPDRDEAGARWLATVRSRLRGVAADLLVARALVGKDPDDHVAAGYDLADLVDVEDGSPGPGPVRDLGPGDEDRRRSPGPDRSHTQGADPGPAAPGPSYFDVAALLDHGLPDPPATDVLARSDGICLFYAGQVNLLFGDPESGKTFVALASVAESLRLGRSALVLDLDHNGPAATISRLLMLGAPASALRDLARFRYIEPEDREDLLAVVVDTQQWHPAVVVLDSVGELLPVFGASSNSPDEFTAVHAHVMKPLARTGACVVLIDHLAKNTESRAQGATGTAAKRRAIGGTSIRVKITETFVPGKGGAALLLIHKDRHGGLREHSPREDREPVAGTFTMSVLDGATCWKVAAPAMSDRDPSEVPPAADVAAVAALDPPPHSVEDARARLRWGKPRTTKAVQQWRTQHASSAGPDRSTPPVSDRSGPAELLPIGGAA